MEGLLSWTSPSLSLWETENHTHTLFNSVSTSLVTEAAFPWQHGQSDVCQFYISSPSPFTICSWRILTRLNWRKREENVSQCAIIWRLNIWNTVAGWFKQTLVWRDQAAVERAGESCCALTPARFISSRASKNLPTRWRLLLMKFSHSDWGEKI